MKYFAIHNSLNKNILGNIPQVKSVKHNCDLKNDPSFIDKFPFKKIELNPILSNPILFSNSNLTDLIDISSIGFSFGSIFISKKLKSLFDVYNCFGIQFYNSFLIKNNKVVENYFQSHVFDLPYEFIDFGKTSIYIKNSITNKINLNEKVTINNFNELREKIDNLEYPFVINFKEIVFNSNMNIDYFFLRYLSHSNKGIVSEKLKKEIEEANCSGIEFRPIELSYQEWTAPGGEREKIYGRSY